MQLYTISDVTPNGTAVSLAASAPAGAPTVATWISFAAVGTSIRVGDSNVGSSRGLLLATDVPIVLAVRGDADQRPYDLSKVYVYGGSGSDKVSVTYGVG
jgi:hypothetical protein